VFVMKAVIAKGIALKYVDQAFQDDKELVMKAVSNNGAAFQHASGRLRDDAQVLEMATTAPSVTVPISYASDRLKDHKQMALTAINQYADAYGFLSQRLREDRDVVLATVSRDGGFLIEVPSAFKADEEIALAAIKSSYSVGYRLVDDSLKASRAFNLKAVAAGNVFDCLAREFKGDREIILAAIHANYQVYSILSEQLQDDPQIALQAIRSKNGPIGVYELSPKFLEDPYINKLHRELLIPPVAQFMLKRHRQYEASKVAAQVDIWMIKNGHCDAFAEHAAAAAKRQRLE
jgi:thiamine phosphate synthase YjbQ (UPF0047 family)